jgi:hypothetical protein
METLDRRTAIGIGAAVAAVLLGVALVFVVGVVPYPDLATVKEQPAPAVPGRLAYVRWDDGACLRVVDGDGTDREVRCDDRLGGPLAWGEDGRTVEVVSFGPTGETVEVVDVESGDVVETRTVGTGSPGIPLEEPGVRERDGAVLSVTRDGSAAVVELREDGETDTVLRLDGPSGYSFWDVRWAPDGDWIAVLDSLDRVLVVSVEGDADARVWVEGAGGQIAWWQPGA